MNINLQNNKKYNIPQTPFKFSKLIRSKILFQYNPNTMTEIYNSSQCSTLITNNFVLPKR